jgi:acrylyl-CoA reductase (NADPH)
VFASLTAYDPDMNNLACRVFREDRRTCARVVPAGDAPVAEGSVVLRAEWSGINFKDALGVTGRAPIYRRFPITAGIDVSGRVISSSDPRFAAGDPVLVNGMGLGESQDGGFAQVVRVPADWVVPLPAGLDLREAMILGTAGFTAALALHRMEANGQAPGAGPIAVTGATGGVGSASVAMLAERGYEVVAVSGRPQHADYLRMLGASAVKTAEELALGTRPLEAARFGGAIDNVGGPLLAGLLRHVKLWGNVAAVGNAAAPAFEGHVFPFILRGVSLLGASSANCPMALRQQLWTRLGAELKPGKLEAIATRTVPLADVVPACESLMDRTSLGRILVDCR